MMYLDYFQCFMENRPRGFKTFFMLNSAEHEILTAQRKKNNFKK